MQSDEQFFAHLSFARTMPEFRSPALSPVERNDDDDDDDGRPPAQKG